MANHMALTYLQHPPAIGARQQQRLAQVAEAIEGSAVKDLGKFMVTRSGQRQKWDMCSLYLVETWHFPMVNGNFKILKLEVRSYHNTGHIFWKYPLT